MYLDAVNESSIGEGFPETTHARSGTNIFEAWEYWQPARVSHHGTVCCEIVREWIVAVDQSAINGGNALTGPRWLRQRFEWGPTRYPIFWCEVGNAKVIDCGVHAALAHEVFLARGVRSYRAQIVQEFSENASTQWQLKWADRDAITTWLDGDFIYHECCAVEIARGEVKLWDPSAGWWIDPRTTIGYGSVRALKVVSVNQKQTFRWGEHLLKSNEWTAMDDGKPICRSNPVISLVPPLQAQGRAGSA